MKLAQQTKKIMATNKLKAMIPINSTVIVIRIDHGRNTRGYDNYYSVLFLQTDELINISGDVALALDRKWSGNVWGNSSAVYARNPQDIVDDLASTIHPSECNLNGNKSLYFKTP